MRVLIEASDSRDDRRNCVAMEFDGPSEDVARTRHPHPTRSEALRQAAMGVKGWTMQA